MKIVSFVIVLLSSFLLVTTPSLAKSFNDNFNSGRTNKWISLPQDIWYGLGNWRVEDSILVQDAGDDHYKFLIEDSVFSNQKVKSDILVHNFGYAGITVWHHNLHNWVDIFVYPAYSLKSFWVIEYVDRVPHYTLYPYTAAHNTWFTLEIVADSDSGEIEAYLDGEQVLTHTVTTPHKQGRSGLNSGNAGGSFDNFRLKAKLR